MEIKTSIETNLSIEELYERALKILKPLKFKFSQVDSNHFRANSGSTLRTLIQNDFTDVKSQLNVTKSSSNTFEITFSSSAYETHHSNLEFPLASDFDSFFDCFIEYLKSGNDLKITEALELKTKRRKAGNKELFSALIITTAVASAVILFVEITGWASDYAFGIILGVSLLIFLLRANKKDAS